MSCACQQTPCRCPMPVQLVNGRLPTCPPTPCTCSLSPCICRFPYGVVLEQDVNPNKNRCTMCSGDTSNNIWFQPGPPGYPGKCKLDEMTFEQVWIVLLRVPQAKKDLLRITENADLLTLASQTSLIQDPIEDDKKVDYLINKQNTLPYYTLLRGNIDGSVK
mgnify:CR=1 FL=1